MQLPSHLFIFYMPLDPQSYLADEITGPNAKHNLTNDPFSPRDFDLTVCKMAESQNELLKYRYQVNSIMENANKNYAFQRKSPE